MKKEVVLAIAIGFILGLIITGGIWIANRSLKNLPQTEATNTTTNEPAAQANPADNAPTTKPADPNTTTPVTNQTLTVSQPVDEALFTTSSISVKGKTVANSIVAVLYELGEQIVTADATGNFSTDITLEGGYNMISITSIAPDNSQSSQNIVVTYTTSKL